MLWKFSRGTVDKPLVYVTEMVAFFKRLERQKIFERVKDVDKPVHNAYQKTAFGIVHFRPTDDECLCVGQCGPEGPAPRS